MNLLSKQKAVFYLTAVFLTGIITGAALGYGLRAWTQRRFPAFEHKAPDFVERLRQELALSEPQVAEIQPAFDSLGKNLHALRTNTIEQASVMIRKTHTEIERFLSPAQIEKLRQLQQTREAELRRRVASGDKSPASGPPHH
jgi:hypothetical protein